MLSSILTCRILFFSFHKQLMLVCCMQVNAIFITSKPHEEEKARMYQLSTQHIMLFPIRVNLKVHNAIYANLMQLNSRQLHCHGEYIIIESY